MEYPGGVFSDGDLDGFDIPIDDQNSLLSGSGLDRLDVLNNQNWISGPRSDLSSQLFDGSSHLNIAQDNLDVVTGDREPSPEVPKWMQNMLASLPSSSGKEVGKDLSKEAIDNQSDNKGIDSVEIPQCRGGMSVAAANKLGVNAQKGKKRGGRPKKAITREDLLRCKDYTLKAAAMELSGSESTLQRRVGELTKYKTWSELRQSKSTSQHAHGKERMQDEDKVVLDANQKKKRIT